MIEIIFHCNQCDSDIFHFFFLISFILFSFLPFDTMDDPADYNVSEYADLTKTWHQDPTAYLDRYYTLFYKITNKELDPLNTDVYVRQSPNKICVLGIAKASSDIKQVKLRNDLVGQKVRYDTILCELLDQDHNVIGHVKAEMEGKLLELNRHLEKDIGLLSDGHHMDTGFIGIIMPKTEDTKFQLKGYLTEAEYKQQNNRTNMESTSV